METPDTSSTWPPPRTLPPEAPALARAPLSLAGVLWYSLANLGYGMFYALNNFVIPLWLGTFTGNAVLLGIMGGSHSFEGVFIQPVVGSISDRLRGPGGTAASLHAGLRPDLRPVPAPRPGRRPPAALGLRLAGVVLCIFLFTLTFNVAMDPYQALLADITTPEQRGKVTGFWFFVGALGQITILALIAVLHLPLAAGLHPRRGADAGDDAADLCADVGAWRSRCRSETPRGKIGDIGARIGRACGRCIRRGSTWSCSCCSERPASGR